MFRLHDRRALDRGGGVVTKVTVSHAAVEENVTIAVTDFRDHTLEGA